MKLFISYRRRDSEHPAHRVRMLLQDGFGDAAVFIDRDIPPGDQWEDHLKTRLAESDGVIVVVGDEFTRLLRKQRPEGEPDMLVREIALALELKKPVYPVIVGLGDMPSRTLLPETIRAFADQQVVFARGDAFEWAIEKLIRSIGARSGAGTLPAAKLAGAAVAAVAAAQAKEAVNWRHVFAAAMAVLVSGWLCGRLIHWLAARSVSAEFDPATFVPAGFEPAVWDGLRYLACTALWGLGPYLAYWVADRRRARANLPIFTAPGVAAALNFGISMLCAGMFLLLSTKPGWKLHPVWLFPPEPQLWHYAALAAVLLFGTIGIAAAAARLEHAARLATDDAKRQRRMRRVHAANVLAALWLAWLALSLVVSTASVPGADPVAVLGYFLLAPLLSLLYVLGWRYSQEELQLPRTGWELRAMCGLVLGLYVLCTLALYAYGMGRVFWG